MPKVSHFGIHKVKKTGKQNVPRNALDMQVLKKVESF